MVRKFRKERLKTNTVEDEWMEDRYIEVGKSEDIERKR